MRLTETVTWRHVEDGAPAHEQLCVVIRASDSEPRILKFNDDDTGTYWYDPTEPLVWSIRTHEYDSWAPAPMAPIAPPVAVAS